MTLDSEMSAGQDPVPMRSIGAIAWRARWPWANSGHGPLPQLLILLTFVTGVVDAVSYVGLGHVFVANMTGNVVLLGFAVAGAPGLSVPASLVALGAFLLGALTGGRVGTLLGANRGHHLSVAAATSSSLVLVATAVAAFGGLPVTQATRYALIVPMALAMGTQNATARRLAVPDLTTTVLTLTVTGMAADSRLAGGKGGHPARRLLAVAGMLAGALAGGVLVVHVDLIAPLAAAATLMATTAIAAYAVSRTRPSWTRNPQPVTGTPTPATRV
jgi:uncharacterized membrane protein YoaK (UPF0700 family)